jgi:peroxiredoxin
MASTATMTHPFGWKATDFDLEGVDGKHHRLSELRGANGTLVMFICNHCPYVKATIDDVVRDCEALKADGVNAIAVMSNDPEAYPDDSFPNMKKFAAAHRLPFPYVIDRTQEVAHGYKAICTPDFFGFDKDLGLRYRGRLMEMRGSQPVKGARRELLDAMREIARTGKATGEQIPAIGCSIKWKA